MSKHKTKSSASNASSAGSMMKMRSGFRGIFKAKKGHARDPKQFYYILGGLMLLFALIYFVKRGLS